MNARNRGMMIHWIKGITPFSYDITGARDVEPLNLIVLITSLLLEKECKAKVTKKDSGIFIITKGNGIFTKFMPKRNR